MDRFGYGSKVNYYITEVIRKLFFDFAAAIANRIEGADYYYHWHHLVAFIIFVIVNRHSECDEESFEVLVKGLSYYIDDKNNNESFINYFGLIDLKSSVANYKSQELSNSTRYLIGQYIEAWRSNKSNPDIAASECFAKNIATDDDHRHLTLAYGFLHNKFSGDNLIDTVPFFNCNK